MDNILATKRYPKNHLNSESLVLTPTNQNFRNIFVQYNRVTKLKQSSNIVRPTGIKTLIEINKNNTL